MHRDQGFVVSKVHITLYVSPFCFLGSSQPQVHRSEGVSVGTLLFKVTRHAASPSSASSKDHVGVDHWMVSIGNIKEDVSERMLGRIVIQSDATLNNTTKRHNSGNSNASIAMESDESTSIVQLNKKESNKTNKLPVGGNNSARSSRNSSARPVHTASRPSTQQYASNKIPKKSRKEVVKVQARPPPPGNKNISKKMHTTRAATRSAGSSVALFRGIEDMVIPPKKQQPRVSMSNSKNDGSVVKVQMLTGVLYLYRDAGKRRARFVRTK